MAYNATQIPLDAYNVTPSDTVANPGFGFRVGTTAGDVAILTGAGRTLTIPAVQVGETIAVVFAKILATGTTATGVTAFGPT